MEPPSRHRVAFLQSLQAVEFAFFDHIQDATAQICASSRHMVIHRPTQDGPLAALIQETLENIFLSSARN
jgi:hypothetical protein